MQVVSSWSAGHQRPLLAYLLLLWLQRDHVIGMDLKEHKNGMLIWNILQLANT